MSRTERISNKPKSETDRIQFLKSPISTGVKKPHLLRPTSHITPQSLTTTSFGETIATIPSTETIATIPPTERVGPVSQSIKTLPPTRPRFSNAQRERIGNLESDIDALELRVEELMRQGSVLAENQQKMTRAYRAYVNLLPYRPEFVPDGNSINITGSKVLIETETIDFTPQGLRDSLEELL